MRNLPENYNSWTDSSGKLEWILKDIQHSCIFIIYYQKILQSLEVNSQIQINLIPQIKDLIVYISNNFIDGNPYITEIIQSSLLVILEVTTYDVNYNLQTKMLEL